MKERRIKLGKLILGYMDKVDPQNDNSPKKLQVHDELHLDINISKTNSR